MFRRFLATTWILLSSFTALHGEETERTIMVNGTGSATATPDMASIQTGVVTEAATAEEALRENSTAMQEVMRELQRAGIESRDIQTSNFSVQPRYAPGRRQEGPSEIDGYRVSNQVHVRIRDLSRLGAVLDRLVSAGSNQIYGISLDVGDKSKLLADARRAAVEDARERAKVYANAAGVKLGAVIRIEERTGADPRPMPMARMAMAEASVPIAEGETELSTSVMMEFAIAAETD